MLKITHSIGGKPVKPPINQSSLSLSIVNNIDRIDKSVDVTEFTWIDDEAKLIREHIESGKVFNKLSHVISINDGDTSFIFNKYIFTPGAKIGINRVDADSVEDKKLDWVTQHARAVTFFALYDEGVITDADFVQVPYTLSSVPDYRGAFITILTTTTVAIHLDDSISELRAVIGEMSTIFDSVGAFIRVLVRIVYIALLVLTLVELILELIDLLVQRVKYTPAMGINEQLRIGLAQLGKTLVTPIPDDYLYIPKQFETIENNEDSRIRGVFFPNNNPLKGYYRGSLGDLIDFVKDLFYMKLEVTDTEVRFVPYQQPPQGARVSVNPLYQVDKETNATDLVPGIYLSFSHDLRDGNTISNWKGTDVDVSYSVAGDFDKDELVPFSKKAIEKIFPVALCTTKKEFSPVEKIIDVVSGVIDGILNAMIKVANVVTGAINKVSKFIDKYLNKVLRLIGAKKIKLSTNIPKIEPVNLGDRLDDRIGMLALENDTFSVDKIARVTVSSNPRNTKISAEITARAMYDLYYRFINTQLIRYRYETNEMNILDVYNVEQDLAMNINSVPARLKTLDWDGYETGGKADIELEVFDDYVSLQEKINEPDASR